MWLFYPSSPKNKNQSQKSCHFKVWLIPRIHPKWKLWKTSFWWASWWKASFCCSRFFFGLIEQSGSQITTVQHAQLNEWRTFSTSLKLCLVTWSMRRHKTPQNWLIVVHTLLIFAWTAACLTFIYVVLCYWF